MYSPEVENILKRVLDLTDRSVLVHEDSSLPTLSAVRMARGDAPVHLIRFQPKASSWLDYLVAFQAGLIIRSFSPPVDDRFDLGPSYWGRREVEKAVNEKIRQAALPLNKEERLGIRDQFVNGLGVQLRSMPVGLRVDQWIIEEYPALQTQQKKCIETQLQDNLGSLRPEVKRLAPDAVFAATVSMSAAFASFWARAWSEVPLTTPFRAVGLLAAGESLLKTWDEPPVIPRMIGSSWKRGRITSASERGTNFCRDRRRRERDMAWAVVPMTM